VLEGGLAIWGFVISVPGRGTRRGRHAGRRTSAFDHIAAGDARESAALETEPDFDSLVTELNARCDACKTDLGLTPAPKAHELTMIVGLARLDRSIPSLEEIRRFEGRPTSAESRPGWTTSCTTDACRLPGRAASTCLCGDGGRPVPALPPKAVPQLAERRHPGESSLSCRCEGYDRR